MRSLVITGISNFVFRYYHSRFLNCSPISGGGGGAGGWAEALLVKISILKCNIRLKALP